MIIITFLAATLTNDGSPTYVFCYLSPIHTRATQPACHVTQLLADYNKEPRVDNSDLAIPRGPSNPPMLSLVFKLRRARQ